MRGRSRQGGFVRSEPLTSELELSPQRRHPVRQGLIMIAQAFETIPILRFPSRAERDGTLNPGDSLTLGEYYRQRLLPELIDLSRRSLESDRLAIRKWEKWTSDPPLSVGTEVLEENLCRFRAGLIESGAAPASINKHWREIKAIFDAAVADGYCRCTPLIHERRRGRVRRSRLVFEPRKRQRELITEAELTRLWSACSAATYPRGGQFSAPRLWRVALVLFWTYGARTGDFLRNLRWEHVRFGDQLLLFSAQKTSKLQGLPLTPTVMAHLRSIQGPSDSRVFPGFNSPGCHLRSPDRWKPGYYATWRGEICEQAALLVPIQLKHFRERVVTRYNAMHPGLGSWIAGHFVPGVSAQHYDLPTDQIREVIYSAPVPECFREIEDS